MPIGAVNHCTPTPPQTNTKTLNLPPNPMCELKCFLSTPPGQTKKATINQGLCIPNLKLLIIEEHSGVQTFFPFTSPSLPPQEKQKKKQTGTWKAK